MLNRTIAIAPMIDWTDRFYRYFLRLITKRTLLYTEMIHVNAILNGHTELLLKYDPSEHPVALQVGGSDSATLAQAAVIAEDYGYDEININVGCPSERVQAGSFGACLMAEPQIIADAVSAMQAKVSIPVTVKSRIGIDDNDHYDYLYQFVDTVRQAGCKVFVVHARIAWLKGLSPKENREIPPLKYDHVYRLKRDFPELSIIINGGITTHEQVSEHLQKVDGVMLGRVAYHDPYVLATVDRDYYHDNHPIPNRIEIIENYLPFVENQLAQGVALNHMTRHLMGIFQGQPNARLWRRYLSEHATKPHAGPQVLQAALLLMDS